MPVASTMSATARDRRTSATWEEAARRRRQQRDGLLGHVGHQQHAHHGPGRDGRARVPPPRRAAEDEGGAQQHGEGEVQRRAGPVGGGEPRENRRAGLEVDGRDAQDAEQEDAAYDGQVDVDGLRVRSRWCVSKSRPCHGGCVYVITSTYPSPGGVLALGKGAADDGAQDEADGPADAAETLDAGELGGRGEQEVEEGAAAEPALAQLMYLTGGACTTRLRYDIPTPSTGRHSRCR